MLPLALGVAVTANAQVTTDQGALDSLPKPAPPPHPARPPLHRAPLHPRPAARAPAQARPVPPVVAAPLPVIPPAPPAAPVIPPPIAVPTLPAAPPPPVPVTATAAGTASRIPDGLRITFGPGSADLNPATEQALVGLAKTASDQPAAAVNVLAHAPGVPEDPSSPRRLSVTRGLAARAVLISQGIPSSRIYLRALGPQELGDGPADRVDVLLGPTPTPAASPPPPPK